MHAAEAYGLIHCRDQELDSLLDSAALLRDKYKGRTVTYSRKVFLPVTNLCRDKCSYCTFRKDPTDLDAWTMSPVEIEDTLVHAAEQSPLGEAWKAVVKTYLSLDLCEHPERGCPLAALAPELARADKKLKPQIAAELANYKSRMMPFMPGRRSADKERALFVIFSTMIGAIEISRMLPERAMRERVLASTRDFLLGSF